jgi:hypothetical protein
MMVGEQNKKAAEVVWATNGNGQRPVKKEAGPKACIQSAVPLPEKILNLKVKEGEEVTFLVTF